MAINYGKLKWSKDDINEKVKWEKGHDFTYITNPLYIPENGDIYYQAINWSELGYVLDGSYIFYGSKKCVDIMKEEINKPIKLKVNKKYIFASKYALISTLKPFIIHDLANLISEYLIIDLEVSFKIFEFGDCRFAYFWINNILIRFGYNINRCDRQRDFFWILIDGIWVLKQDYPINENKIIKNLKLNDQYQLILYDLVYFYRDYIKYLNKN